MAKTSFSCFGSEEFRSELAKTSAETLIIAGMETHVCVQQTAFDALQQGMNVVVVSDGVVSRRESDREVALRLMLTAGVHVTTSESIVLDLLRDASHPSFKAVSNLLK